MIRPTSSAARRPAPHRPSTVAPRVAPRVALAAALAAALVSLGIVAGAGPAAAVLPGAHSDLTRAPYLTDLTATSVQVNWATLAQSRGIVRYGPAGDCAAHQVQSTPAGNPITVGTTREYSNTVAVTGLSAGTTYCYRVLTATGTDLLGTLTTPTFSTLDAAAASAPLTFAVMGDWGDTTNSGVNDGSLNANQGGVEARIAASGARFAVSTGDTAYPGGSQTNYGDLNQTGVDVSGVFGPSYWAVPGQRVPAYVVSGNHGKNNTYLVNWPQEATRAASGGVYGMVSYPTVESLYGTVPGGYPTSYYAFSANGVRFYLLDAAWGNSNVGSATGGACGSHCAIYQVDHDAHWTPAAAQYQWLAADLAAHPGGLKLAFFHFPLRSDDATEPGDTYLQNLPGTSGTLEKLLADNGVRMAFNGHAHTYQRNVAPPGGVISYVTGGGGAKATSIGGGSGCSPTDAYGIGWSYSSAKGNRCGAAAAPASDRNVYHFLKVTVNGSNVTVTPVDSTGAVFDQQTYDFGADAQVPTAPGGLAATRPSGTKVALTWTAAADNVGVHAVDVYRDGTYVGTVPGTVLGYTDTIVAGSSHTYQVKARDLAGNTATASVTSSGSGGVDTTAPTVPTGLAGSVTGPQRVSLSWAPSTDDVGVASYGVLRGGTPVGTVAAPATTYADTGLTPGTAYTYTVTAADGAGNVSTASAPAIVTLPPDVTAPTAPGAPVATSVTASRVSLQWTASTDDVGVARYDVLRDGAAVGSSTTTTFADTTVAPSTGYSYVVRAYDAAGNATSGGALALTTPAVGEVFADGFESGALAPTWETVSGLTVQSALTHAGSQAARQTSTGTATYAYKTLSPAATERWAQVWVNVVGRSTAANLLGFRTSTGASIVNLYLDASGRLSLRNNIGGVTTLSTTVPATGTWHRVVLHTVVDATSGRVDVSLDGTAVPGLALTGQNFGTAPIARLQLGETATARTYDIALDDVLVSSVALS